MTSRIHQLGHQVLQMAAEDDRWLFRPSRLAGKRCEQRKSADVLPFPRAPRRARPNLWGYERCWTFGVNTSTAFAISSWRFISQSKSR